MEGFNGRSIPPGSNPGSISREFQVKAREALFSQPRPKKCATHCYIARSIKYFKHGTSKAGLVGSKPADLNAAIQSLDIAGPGVYNLHDKGQKDHDSTEKGSQPPTTAQTKQQIFMQHASQSNNIMEDTVDPNDDTQCTLFEGMHYSEASSSKGRKRRKSTSGGGEGGDDENESVGDDIVLGASVKKKKGTKVKGQETSKTEDLNTVLELIRKYSDEQQKIDMEWMKRMEKREQERILFESEWRKKMEKLQREEMMMEEARRERQEQRWLREDSLAKKRDALLTALLKKLND